MTRAQDMVERLRAMGKLGLGSKGRWGGSATPKQFRATLERRMRDRGSLYGEREQAATEYAVWLRYHKKFRCCYCGDKPELARRRIDHWMPLARGGRHEVENLVPSCQKCNASKGPKIWDKPSVVESLEPKRWRLTWDGKSSPMQYEGDDWFEEWCAENS